jgi:hypothetical protein
MMSIHNVAKDRKVTSFMQFLKTSVQTMSY